MIIILTKSPSKNKNNACKWQHCKLHFIIIFDNFNKLLLSKKRLKCTSKLLEFQTFLFQNMFNCMLEDNDIRFWQIAGALQDEIPLKQLTVKFIQLNI